MKLFFCDICNESIPLQDIKENRSTTIKGKIFCRACNPLNELSGGDSGGATTSAGGAGSGAVTLLAVLVLGLAGAVGYLFYDLKMGAEPAPEGESPEVAALSGRVADLDTVVKGLQVGFDGMMPLRDLPAQVDGLRGESTSRNAELARLSSEMKAVQEQLVAVGNLRDRIEGLSLTQDENATRVKAVLADLDAVKRGLTELGERPAVIVERVGPDGAGGDDPQPVPGAPDEELLAIIEKLSDDDAMARWEAVDQLRRRKDPALAPHVMTLLDDRDTFVRAQAIYTLGELKAMKAVPKLIKLLRDDESMIAEEALASLIIITGQNYRFDLSGSKAAREKGIRKWEEWADKNKAKFE